MAEELGLEVARNDSLRQLAGEVASYLVESQLGAVRSSGSRKIFDDHVFTSGTPFRLPGQSGGLSREPLATEFLIRHLSDEALASLVEMIMAEQRRRGRS